MPELVPIRHGRMLVSPCTFYRGAALPMAADLATTPTSGLRVQLCGDAHLANFGAFASPARRLVFDVNDFDETLPGPFEWDVKRLAASLAVAGRDNGFPAKDRRKVILAGVERYRTAMREFAGQPFLAVWYAHLDVEDTIAQFRSQLKKKRVKAVEKMVAKAHTHDSMKAQRKLTTQVDGQRRIISDPPLIEPIEEVFSGEQASANCGRSQYTNQGERVVAGQHLMQAESDIFLGWTRAAGPDRVDRDFYVRQLKDWNLSAPIEAMIPSGMTVYAGRADGPWPAPMPAPATASRWPPTSTAHPNSTRRSPTSPRPTPTRTNGTTPRSRPPSKTAKRRQRPRSEP